MGGFFQTEFVGLPKTSKTTARDIEHKHKPNINPEKKLNERKDALDESIEKKRQMKLDVCRLTEEERKERQRKRNDILGEFLNEVLEKASNEFDRAMDENVSDDEGDVSIYASFNSSTFVPLPEGEKAETVLKKLKEADPTHPDKQRREEALKWLDEKFAGLNVQTFVSHANERYKALVIPLSKEERKQFEKGKRYFLAHFYCRQN